LVRELTTSTPGGDEAKLVDAWPVWQLVTTDDKKGAWRCNGDNTLTLPTWVHRHCAFMYLKKHATQTVAINSPFVLYLVIGQAACTPEPFHEQAYVGLASNSLHDRWTGHKADIKRLLHARGDHVVLTRLIKETQLVDTNLAVLASRGLLHSDAFLFLVSSHESQKAMEAAEKEWRSSAELSLTDMRFGWNIL
jgi:hypothetical protein